MMAVAAADAFDDPDWVFEPKWDGVRVLAHVGRGSVRLMSRNGNDVSAAYPELDVLADVFGDGTIVDGEVVAFDAGRPSFERLQSRMHVRRASSVRSLMADTPVVFMAFDVVALDGRSLASEPLEERRRLLEGAVVPGPHLQLSPQVEAAGIALFAATAAQGLEGVVAKRKGSRYEPGRRSRSWVKIKVVHQVDVVVVGWRPGSGGRAGTVGSLVVALFDADGTLQPVGSVGSGLDSGSLAALSELVGMIEREEPPLATDRIPDHREVRWVEPSLVAVVEYREVTGSGHLRAPVFAGMRTDKDPGECTLDQLVRAPGPS